jgi:hypothetical protein
VSPLSARPSGQEQLTPEAPPPAPGLAIKRQRDDDESHAKKKKARLLQCPERDQPGHICNDFCIECWHLDEPESGKKEMFSCKVIKVEGCPDIFDLT